MKRPLILAITGASGVIYGVEMLRILTELNEPVHLIMSESAGVNLSIETGFKLKEVREMATTVHSNKNLGASISSGSFRTRGMIIAPCTIKTLSAVANSYNESLIVRAADVCLKENRKLVLMVRETPLHTGHLDLMARTANLGAIILPPVPSFYHQPKTIMDIVHQSIGKALDQFEIEHNLFTRWGGEDENKENSAQLE
jgi:flavin prenyltransferase